MTSWIVGAVLVGLSLVILGLVGRRAGDEPRCRRCAFDLSGQPEPSTGACPECGADLACARAARRGLRKRRWLVFALGLVCLAPGGVWLGLLAYNASTTPAKQPTWFLLLRAERGSIHGARETLEELTNRFGSREITYAQLAPIVDRGLTLMLDESIAWNGSLTYSWSEFCKSSVRSGRMTEAQEARFDFAARPIEVFPLGLVYEAGEPRLRIGARASVSPRAPSGIANTGYEVRPVAITIGSDRRAVRPPAGETVTSSAHIGVLNSRPPDWFVPAPQTPGLHELTVEFVSRGVRTTTRPSRSTLVRIVPPGGAYEPVDTRDGAETAKRSVLARVTMHNDFDYHADRHFPASGEAFPPAAFIEFTIARSRVGGVFDVWLITRGGRAVLLLEGCVFPILQGADDPSLGVRFHRATTILSRKEPGEWAQPPFDPADIPGDGLRLVFEPCEHRVLVRSPHSKPLRDDWTAPPTLVRRFTAPLEERIGDVARRIRARCFGVAEEFEPSASVRARFGEPLLTKMLRESPRAFARDTPGEYIWVPPPDE